jgi:hypothetical protein
LSKQKFSVSCKSVVCCLLPVVRSTSRGEKEVKDDRNTLRENTEAELKKQARSCKIRDEKLHLQSSEKEANPVVSGYFLPPGWRNW